MQTRVAVMGLAALPLAAFVAMVRPLPVHAASFTVNTSADAPANPADCSADNNTCTLRDAIALADAAGGANTITIAWYVKAPIDLTVGPLAVTPQALTIIGNGTGSTIVDGSGVDGPAFEISAQCTGAEVAQCAESLTLAHLTVRNATRTGVADFGAALIVENDVFAGNHAISGGAIDAIGPLEVTGSTFNDNTAKIGGAIDEVAADADVSVTTSTFTGNSATNGDGLAEGGAIDHWLDGGGALDVSRSTFSGNSSAFDGGAIWAGVHNCCGPASSIAIDDSTFIGNTATDDGGAFLDSSDAASLVNDTFTGNTASGSGPPTTHRAPRQAQDVGGAVSAPSNSVATGALTFSDDLLVSNTPVNCDYPTDSTPATVTADHSIDTGASCAFGTANGNVQNQDPAGLHLDSQLRDNGSRPQTIALLPGSAAIDAGSNSTCSATDERGVERPQHGTCDVGAFEVVVTSTTIQATGGGGDVVLFAVVVGRSDDGGYPQGTVTFTKNGVAIGSAAVHEDLTATIDIPLKTAADPLFGAVYTPTNGFFGSSGSTSFTPTIPVPDTGGAVAPAGGGLLLLTGLGLVAAGRRRR